ncbi:MAG: glucuronate isomerase [Rubritalea sp.]|jgi:glucuronate isomerase
MNYLHDNVFLTTETAQRLYHETAKGLPIIDFHTHLPQAEIFNNHRFENLWELWLKHDHYKWRLMRGCGIDERRITGDASPWEKFEAFASIMPLAVGNPVHHWAHLELQRVFGIEQMLNLENAKAIWDDANKQIAEKDELTVQGLLGKFNVELVCTTDAPDSDLSTHTEINQSEITTKVYPTFRVDLAEDTTSLYDLTALKKQHDYFHENGCRLSDHGMPNMPDPSSAAFDVLNHIAKWNKEKGWTMQLHLGPQRRVNESMTAITGADSGFDTMGSWSQTAPLIKALNAMQNAGTLSRTIVYNLNSNESEPICCALQNFQNSEAKGLVQYGPAWWHLDNVRGIREQMDILTSLGAIGTSLGMLTDSRSFTSYVRHEYYRRLLCQYIGNAAEAGEMPNEPEALNQLIADICYHNPKNYFNWA